MKYEWRGGFPLKRKNIIIAFILLGVLSCVFTYIIHCAAGELCIDHVLRYLFLGGVLGGIVGILVTVAEGLSQDDTWETNV